MDRPDTDFAFRLTEVYPDGRSIALGQIIQRMRFRSGYTASDEEFMHTGEVFEITVAFEHLANTFKAGNRIRLIVSSSNYPWFNRNMNTGAEMYPNGNLDTLVNPLIAYNTIHLQGKFPSRIVLPALQITSRVQQIKGWRPTIFPNPTDQLIFLHDTPPGTDTALYNSSGLCVLRETTVYPEQSVSVNQLPAGAYFLQLISEGKAYWSKIIVQ